MKSFYSNGKLLLSGEYVVLDGAIALAIPTAYGQFLDIEKNESPQLKWTSLDDNEHVWFDAEFALRNNQIINVDGDEHPISKRLSQILNAARQLNPKFLTDNVGYKVTSALGFPKHWGLGTSSTLIQNIASWAKVDAFSLLDMTFGGSGYDIACAKANQALTYQLIKLHPDKMERIINFVHFDPPFKNHLYFVHLNQKQNSREGIAHYRANTSDVSTTILRINTITNEMIACESLTQFQNLMDAHEQLISEIIQLTPIKQQLFKDFKGSIKSLGAWGGDFIMVASEENPTSYFSNRGYHTILSFTEMVKN